ncbi:hypothetical protein NKI96_22520 [Mesorhizobium sp. M0292]|uniref:hypothetical protein n=1 Tax=Mesorhizobium sp. M0292 TaxID=2956929 RepID=UPI003338EB0B
MHPISPFRLECLQAPGKPKSDNREDDKDKVQILACGDEQRIDRIAIMAEEEFAVPYCLA